MHSVVGTRYASALADVVLTAGSGLDPVKVAEQLKGIEDLIQASPDLKHVMLSPAVASAKKRAVIAKLSSGLGLVKQVQNFIYVVIDHRRMDQLAEIREAFEAAVDIQQNVVQAKVTSAQALTDAQRGLLQSEFEKLTGKKVNADYEVDDSLIGGAITRIGSTVYDGSVKGQLEKLRRKLISEA
jgi:F-type H+-transporting ATPase subunit delta